MERLGALVGAVGNHEAKAVFFLSLQEDEPYGVMALHRRFLEIQGHPVAFRGSLTLPQKYIMHSYEPAGLCREMEGEEFRRHVMIDADGYGAALAGLVLSLTEHRELSLRQLFGKALPAVSPLRRMDLLRAALSTSGEPGQAHLVRLTGVPVIELRGPCEALHDAGLLTYSAQPTSDMKSTYRVVQPLTTTTRTRALVAAIADFLNARLAQSGSPLDIARDEIEDHLLSLERWQGKSIRDGLRVSLARLVRDGRLHELITHGGDYRQSRVSFTRQQREVSSSIVAALDAFAAGDRDVYEHGLAYGRAVVADPIRVRGLFRKTFEKNKVLLDPVSEAERRALVLGAVGAGAETSQEVLAALAPRLSKKSVGDTLCELTRDGLLVSSPQLRTTQKRWQLPDLESS